MALTYGKKGKTAYGYIRKKAPAKGIRSIWLFGAALLCFAVVIVSNAGKDEPGILSGGILMISAILCICGIWNARQSFHEPDRAYGISKIGIVLNSIFLILLVIMFLIGLI